MEKIVDFIEECAKKSELFEADIIKLGELSESADSDIAYDICEMLGQFPSSGSESILLSMLGSSDYLIRAAACDSLRFSRSPEVMTRLFSLLKDKNRLARGYAALSIGDIQKNIAGNAEKTVNMLKQFHSKEKNIWAKTAMARSLFLLGDDSYLQDLIVAVDNRSYKIRSFALNLMTELMEDYGITPDSERILPTLYKRKKIEKAVCVNESADRLIALLTE